MNKFNQDLSNRVWTSRDALLGIVAGAAVIGVGATVAARRSSRRASSIDRPAALRAYLADHLTGSDAAFVVVSRMHASQEGAAEAELFARLHREFTEERQIVNALLRSLGGSPFSAKRLAGQAAGAVLQAAAGGEAGELALFRTLESLAVGVQGKRCLWRVAQALEPSLRAPTAQTFRALEMQAVDQWEHIEACRLALASRTFAVDGNR